MTTTFEDANAKLRQAVEVRREAQAAGKPHEEWYGVTGDGSVITQPPVAERHQWSAEKVLERFGDVSQATTNYVEPVGNSEQLEHLREYRAYPMTPDELDEALERLAGDGILKEQPGSLPFLELLEELRTLHFEKTAAYGGATDPFENVTASAKCGVEPWRRALCDLSDCVVRMQRYANGQPVDYENALIDAANWSLICLLKLREAKRG